MKSDNVYNSEHICAHIHVFGNTRKGKEMKSFVLSFFYKLGLPCPAQLMMLLW